MKFGLGRERSWCGENSWDERALLELLPEVGVNQGIKEAQNIIDALRSLRPEVLALHLKHYQRVKAARLCLRWSEELILPWAETARRAASKHLTGSRWSARLKSGTRLQPLLMNSASIEVVRLLLEAIPVGDDQKTHSGQ